MPSVQVCREWESTALKVNGDVRVALIRIGVVLGKDGGALGMTSKLQNSGLVYIFWHPILSTYPFRLISVLAFE